MKVVAYHCMVGCYTWREAAGTVGGCYTEAGLGVATCIVVVALETIRKVLRYSKRDDIQ